ncbi:MAG: Flp family type IVb pilin [Pseudomonadota bacterium]
MVRLVNAFVKDERGATAIEYSIIVLMIGVASVYAFTLVGVPVTDIFNRVAEGFL